MSTKIKVLFIVAFCAAGSLLLLQLGMPTTKEASSRSIPAALIAGELTPEVVEDIFETYRDPATGRIPLGMRRHELAYVQTLPRSSAHKQGSTSQLQWTEAGPSDIGGRTRVLAFDVADPTTILAGGVYGGIWKSTNAGQTWTLKTTVAEHPGVTALVQDPRPGHTGTWYYGSGEVRGDITVSDRGFTAIYNGVGLYKSEDNGETWTLLPATADPNPTGCCDAFDYVHRLAINPNTGTLFIASNADGIYRSDDGGASFSLALGTAQQYSWTEVAAAPHGALVASLSSSGNPSGVYRSTDDGLSWAPITPASFPNTHARSVIAVAPSNPDLGYIMTWVSSNRGDGREDIRFHTLDLVNGGGEDRTANLPNFPGHVLLGPSVHTFGNFTMTLSVKPDDEDFVVFGGVSIFRSRDGLTTPLVNKAAVHIGGRRDFTTGALFPNHFVDNHTLVFHPRNPDEMWCGNDNGISVMRDVTAPPVWEAVDEGYNVAQFYGIDLAEAAGDRRLAGGLQDYGTILFADLRDDPTSPDFSDSRHILSADAGYAHVGTDFLYGTVGYGILLRWRFAGETSVSGQTVIPLPSSATGQRFINPFAVDPNDERIMYYPAGRTLWRNDDLEAPNPGSFWTQATTAPSGYNFRAVAVSHAPAHIVYLGANHPTAPPRVYRWEAANTGPATLDDISIPDAPAGAYIHSIAVHPENADDILVVMSNYNIIGLYHSADGGASYTAVEGNLHGEGRGPSLRSATMLEADDGTRHYIVGTSAGLFSTTALDGMNTVWQQEAYEQLGNIVVEHVTSRQSDGRVAVGTHGRGAFVGTLSAPVANEPAGVPEGFSLTQNYPNPFNPTTQIHFTLHEPGRVTLSVYDVQGRRVAQLLQGRQRPAGPHAVSFDGTGLTSGVYLYQLELLTHQGATYRESRRMTLLR